MPSSHSPDSLVIGFDDDHAVANAGLVLPATLGERMGIEALVDQLVDLGDRPGHRLPGRKVLTLVHAMVAGGDCIDDAEVLRTGSTAAVLGHREVHVITRTAPPTATPESWATIRCSPPWLTPGELLHLRMRKGSANTARGAERFLNELAGRIRRAGAAGELVLRADSGFWAAKVIHACRRHRIRFSISTTPTAASPRSPRPGQRLVVRRTRLVGVQATLWPDWRYHAFITDGEGGAVTLDTDHRRHAVCELAIRYLKDGSGSATVPGGTSWPTPPGPPSPRSPTTCCAGSPP